MSALHRGAGGYRAVDVRALVHPVETGFIHQFSRQLGLELDVFI